MLQNACQLTLFPSKLQIRNRSNASTDSDKLFTCADSDIDLSRGEFYLRTSLLISALIG